MAAGWPSFDEAVAKADEIVVPVQVNGKLRARLTVPAETTEEALRELALADAQVVKHLDGKTVRKSWWLAVMVGQKACQYRGELNRRRADRWADENDDSTAPEWRGPPVAHRR